MGIRQRFEHGKALLNQGVDLLLLRLQVLRMCSGWRFGWCCPARC